MTEQPEPTEDIAVRDNSELHRYEIRVDGQLAGFAEYRDAGPIARAFVHTEIADEFGGRGLGSKLIRQVLDEQRAAGRQVLPYCPFVKAYISSHPDYLDLVPASQRAKFGLEADA